MSINPDLAEAVENIGGQVATAIALGVPRYQNVQHWLRVGQAPAPFCPRLERLSGVSRLKLRPKEAADIWPELYEASEKRAA